MNFEQALKEQVEASADAHIALLNTDIEALLGLGMTVAVVKLVLRNRYERMLGQIDEL